MIRCQLITFTWGERNEKKKRDSSMVAKKKYIILFYSILFYSWKCTVWLRATILYIIFVCVSAFLWKMLSARWLDIWTTIGDSQMCGLWNAWQQNKQKKYNNNICRLSCQIFHTQHERIKRRKGKKKKKQQNPNPKIRLLCAYLYVKRLIGHSTCFPFFLADEKYP